MSYQSFGQTQAVNNLRSTRKQWNNSKISCIAHKKLPSSGQVAHTIILKAMTIMVTIEILNFYWKYIMFGLILRNVFADHQRQEQDVIQSGLDWTIIRPGAFVEGEHTDKPPRFSRHR